jgi:gag-polypeptide of LTR copia-type/Zinc knuckle
MDLQLKINGFSGEKKDWDRWSITFLAKARLNGYRNLLVGIETMPSKGGKGYNDFVAKDDFAFAKLLISSECDICLGLVNTSISEELPEGDAHLAWKNLISKYAPVTKFSLIKTKKEFTDSKLEDITQDPDEWIQSLEILRQRLAVLGHPVSEMDLIIHIVHNLPEEYENTVEFIQNELEDSEISLDKVKERLRMKFERLKTSSLKVEKALVSIGKFKGNCSYCGIYGHKGKDCRKRLNLKKKGTGNVSGNTMNVNDGSPKGKITCYKCQKKGHIARSCPLKKRGNDSSEAAQVSLE